MNQDIPKPPGYFIRVPQNSCSGLCNQGRLCDCAPDLPTEWPPFTARIAAIAVLVVMLAAGLSAFFPIG